MNSVLSEVGNLDAALVLMEKLENFSTSMDELLDAMTLFVNTGSISFSPAVDMNLRVLLISRLLTEQPEFIDIAKRYVEPADFYDILRHTIYPLNGQGRIGGKAAGIFLATRILRDSGLKFRTPKTWYISSQVLHTFLSFNNLRDVVGQKYKQSEQIGDEYPAIIEIFKQATFPDSILTQLQCVLDDFDGKPLIIRSSSLLEDRMGATFSGKYKSLFIANQGTPQQRLDALVQTIAEVYASTFGPDPIAYRKERNLLDYHEEMGILIQEVVGCGVDRFFFPAFAGVAFSSNEFRWSPRLHREDGLLRLVPGLGTRAVDRIGDEYPLLIAPGQPDLRVNTNPEEMIRYSPHKMDVIDMDENRFRTVTVTEMLSVVQYHYPQVEKLFSVSEDGVIQSRSAFMTDFVNDTLLFTMNGFLRQSSFLADMRKLLKLLEVSIGTAVDVEFAHDGEHLYILQCRAQSIGTDNAPALIPSDIPIKDILFTANAFISNGQIPQIRYIVYVEPFTYKALPRLLDLCNVGKIVSLLNHLLPRRSFILMGPGRWGSRGDIKLGVKVTYSDINNTAMLIEIARREGGYMPDLSFGTHFFQDLVEASIRYLPLYPDNPGIIFQEDFLLQTENLLPKWIPEYASLQHVVHVTDVYKSSNGRILRILMNADTNQAVAFLDEPTVPVS